ncbi:MAG: hypothetical protein ACRDHE_17015, partial [Ktedonobacterales bacterium]
PYLLQSAPHLAPRLILEHLARRVQYALDETSTYRAHPILPCTDLSAMPGQPTRLPRQRAGET